MPRETPLWSEDAERAVLAALLIAGAEDQLRLATAVAEHLTPARFYSGAHAKVYEAMEELRQLRTTIDPVTLSHQLEANGTLAAAGGKEFLGGLYDEIPTTANAMHHVAIVVEFWKRRELAHLAKQIHAMTLDRSVNIDDAFTWASRTLAPMASGRQGEKGFRRIKEGLWATMERLEQRKAGTAAALVPTHLRELDDKLNGGLERGELVVVGGVPSCGKTTLVWNLLRELTIQGYGPTGFVSAEMSEGMLLESALATEAEVARGDLKSGKLTDADWQALAKAAARLVTQPIYVDDTVQPSITDVENRCRLLKAREPNLVAIGVDFIQLLQAGDTSGRELRAEQITQVVYRLKAIALELGVVVIALAQPNDKQIEDRDDKRPQLRDLQGSSGMRQAADHVWLLYRRRMYDASAADTIEINLAKQKSGATGAVTLNWDGPRLRVISPAEQRLREMAALNERDRQRELATPPALQLERGGA